MKPMIKFFGNMVISGVNLVAKNTVEQRIWERRAGIDEKRAQNAFVRETKMKTLESGLGMAGGLGGSVSIAIEERAKRKTEAVRNDFEIRKTQIEEENYEKRLKFEKEIEELEKDNDLQRRKDVLASIQNYQLEVTKAMHGSMMILAGMPLELQERAERMLLEEREKYAEFQQKWDEDAIQKMERIQTSFANNERIRIKMEDVIFDGMKEMLQMATDTIKRMEQNVSALNDNARMLSQKGEMMVELHTRSMLPNEKAKYFISES